jgi:gliding motility-associated lipoprotein GldD
MNKFLYSLLVFFLFVACEDENPVPKPPTYLKLDLPEHTYRQVQSDCPYSLKLANSFNYREAQKQGSTYCTQEIDLGPVNGSLFMYYLNFPNNDSLAEIINFANDKVDEHKIKADKIDFEQIIDKENKVYGTFFELKGNVATNFQFYLTDSTNNFVRGEVLLNCKPNYDSLRPVLEYLKIDLLELVHHFKWSKK